jgi:hypothetical protein
MPAASGVVGQGRAAHEAGRERETTIHDGFLHDFVRVPVGVESRFDRSAVSKPARPGIFGIEPVPLALSSRTAPIPIRLQAQPNVDFPALPPKAAGNLKNRTEQAP